jgi:hypothetical protein
MPKTELTGALVRSGSLARLIPTLPSTLSLVLDEYNREVDSYRALHRTCAALEISARFLAVILISELWWRRDVRDSDFPDSLLDRLVQHIERPTLASWRVLLEAAASCLPGPKGRKQSLLPALPGYIAEFTAALGSNKNDARN